VKLGEVTASPADRVIAVAVAGRRSGGRRRRVRVPAAGYANPWIAGLGQGACADVSVVRCHANRVDHTGLSRRT
jgi:hypothetical protein